MSCKHENTKTIATYAYNCSVAEYPHTHENRAAHGNITECEECISCGARRLANVNQRHCEFSAWGASRAEREAADQHRDEQLRIDQEAGEDEALRVSGLSLRKVCASGDIQLIRRVGQKKYLVEACLDDIIAAAKQHDNGDGLVQAYKALIRKINAIRVEY